MIKPRKIKRPPALWVQIRDAGKPAPKKQRKRVRQVSSAQRVRWDEYARAKVLFLMGRTRCERCNCVAVLELHHKRSRIGPLLTDHRYFAALCGKCHRWVHEHPAQARAAGLLAGLGEWGRADE